MESMGAGDLPALLSDYAADAKSFTILTHPEMNRAIGARMADILEGGSPRHFLPPAEGEPSP